MSELFLGTALSMDLNCNLREPSTFAADITIDKIQIFDC